MSEQHQINRIEHKLNAVLQAQRLLIGLAIGELDMSKLHDDLLAVAHELDTKADALGTAADAIIAAKTEGEQQMADVQTALEGASTKMQALQARLAAAAADNAAVGGSTGGGSGGGGTSADTSGLQTGA